MIFNSWKKIRARSDKTKSFSESATQEENIDNFNGVILNIHPSLLPKFPGLNTHKRALEANEEWHGCTVHIVTKELDAGPPIIQCRVPIKKDDDDRLLYKGESLFFFFFFFLRYANVLASPGAGPSKDRWKYGSTGNK